MRFVISIVAALMIMGLAAFDTMPMRQPPSLSLNGCDSSERIDVPITDEHLDRGWLAVASLRLSTKNVYGALAGDCVRFARNAGTASRAHCCAASSSQSRQPGR